MAPHKFNEWQVDLKFHQSAKTSAPHRHVANPGGGHKAEFVSWRWEPMKNLPDLIVPFKRPVYERVVKEFSRLAGN